jgi:hypothetical protein
MAVWYRLIVVISYIFPTLVCLYQEKSGNPALDNVIYFKGTIFQGSTKQSGHTDGGVEPGNTENRGPFFNKTFRYSIKRLLQSTYNSWQVEENGWRDSNPGPFVF